MKFYIISGIQLGYLTIHVQEQEYSSYTMTILKYVLKEDLNKITDLLSKIEVDLMGLTSCKEHNSKIAQILLDYKYAVEKGLK